MLFFAGCREVSAGVRGKVPDLSTATIAGAAFAPAVGQVVARRLGSGRGYGVALLSVEGAGRRGREECHHYAQRQTDG